MSDVDANIRIGAEWKGQAAVSNALQGVSNFRDAIINMGQGIDQTKTVTSGYTDAVELQLKSERKRLEIMRAGFQEIRLNTLSWKTFGMVTQDVHSIIQKGINFWNQLNLAQVTQEQIAGRMRDAQQRVRDIQREINEEMAKATPNLNKVSQLMDAQQRAAKQLADAQKALAREQREAQLAMVGMAFQIPSLINNFANLRIHVQQFQFVQRLLHADLGVTRVQVGAVTATNYASVGGWTAVRAGASSAAVGVRGFFVAMGPIGWVILGVSAIMLAWQTNLFGLRDAIKSSVEWIIKMTESIKPLHDVIKFLAEISGQAQKTLSGDLTGALEETTAAGYDVPPSMNAAAGGIAEVGKSAVTASKDLGLFGKELKNVREVSRLSFEDIGKSAQIFAIRLEREMNVAKERGPQEFRRAQLEARDAVKDILNQMHDDQNLTWTQIGKMIQNFPPIWQKVFDSLVQTTMEASLGVGIAMEFVGQKVIVESGRMATGLSLVEEIFNRLSSISQQSELIGQRGVTFGRGARVPQISPANAARNEADQRTLMEQSRSLGRMAQSILVEMGMTPFAIFGGGIQQGGLTFSPNYTQALSEFGTLFTRSQEGEIRYGLPSIFQSSVTRSVMDALFGGFGAFDRSAAWDLLSSRWGGGGGRYLPRYDVLSREEFLARKTAKHGLHEWLSENTLIRAHKGERVDIDRGERMSRQNLNINIITDRMGRLLSVEEEVTGLRIPLLKTVKPRLIA